MKLSERYIIFEDDKYYTCVSESEKSVRVDALKRRNPNKTYRTELVTHDGNVLEEYNDSGSFNVSSS